MNSELALRLGSLSEKNRKERIVLFFGRESFSDNTKYLYLKALEHDSNFKCIWCSCEKDLISVLEKNNLPCHLISAESFEDTVRLFLSAAVAVFSVNPSQSLNGNEALFACLKGARQIQLWHGVSVKHLQLKLIKHLSVTDYNLRRPFDFATNADCILSTSSHLDDFFSDAFGCQRIIRAGYPRNEVICRKATSLEVIGSEIPPAMLAALKNEKRKKVLFTPTWQREGSPIVTGSSSFLAKLALHCTKNNIDLYVKVHPGLINNNETRCVKEGLWYINPSFDIYPYLKFFDALITDYSSIMFDFLLTNKPVLRLEIENGAHRSYEPDYTLIPDINFAYEYTENSIGQVLQQALTRDDKQEERKKMASALFETDAIEACDSLVRFLKHEVDCCIESCRRFSVEEY